MNTDVFWLAPNSIFFLISGYYLEIRSFSRNPDFQVLSLVFLESKHWDEELQISSFCGSWSQKSILKEQEAETDKEEKLAKG